MEEIMGAFYLHVNGSLIWKPAAVFLNTSPEEYFEGGMVVKWWTIPEKMPGATVEEAVSEFVLPMLRDMRESGARKLQDREGSARRDDIHNAVA